MKKDRLFGLKGPQATLFGLVIYIVTSFVETSIILGTVLGVVALWFFVLGLVRWNKEIKERKLKK